MAQEQIERRATQRQVLHLWTVSRKHGSIVRRDVIMTDPSIAGFRFRGPADFVVGSALFLELMPNLPVQATIQWKHETLPEFGCRFLRPMSQVIVDRIVGPFQSMVEYAQAS